MQIWLIIINWWFAIWKRRYFDILVEFSFAWKSRFETWKLLKMFFEWSHLFQAESVWVCAMGSDSTAHPLTHSHLALWDDCWSKIEQIEELQMKRRQHGEEEKIPSEACFWHGLSRRMVRQTEADQDATGNDREWEQTKNRTCDCIFWQRNQTEVGGLECGSTLWCHSFTAPAPER